MSAIARVDGSWLILAANEAGTGERWDVAAGRLINELDWQDSSLSAVTLSSGGHTCTAGTDDGLVLVRDQDR